MAVNRGKENDMKNIEVCNEKKYHLIKVEEHTGCVYGRLYNGLSKRFCTNESSYYRLGNGSNPSQYKHYTYLEEMELFKMVLQEALGHYPDDERVLEALDSGDLTVNQDTAGNEIIYYLDEFLAEACYSVAKGRFLESEEIAEVKLWA